MKISPLSIARQLLPFIQVLLLFLSVAGQEQLPPALSAPQPSNTHQTQSLRHNISADRDRTVDPATYYIGCGDVFEIRSTKIPWAFYTGTVNETGVLFIPEFGSLRLGKITLAEATLAIDHHIKGKNSSLGEINITLSELKNVGVLLSGSIENAGTYHVTGNTRIMDVLKIAFKDALPSLRSINLRSVILRQKENVDSIIIVDIIRYIATGDLANNPYVYPGQSIHCVPREAYALVTGEVCLTLPDTMPIRPGESIADMLSLYTFTALADTMHIVVLKAGKESRVVSLSQCRQVPIEPGDCITVSPMAQRKQLFTIRVSGEVARPGVYTLWTSDNDKNTVSSALAVAGGITTFGDRRRTYVVRRGIVNRTRQKTIIESSKSLRPQINYGMIRLLESNDFSILHGNDETVHLEDKDEVVVPRIENSVYVSGQVRNPGAFHFIPEKNSDYYISRAGGLAHSGDKKNIRVLTLYGDAFQLREKKNIEPGDIITIPEKEEQPWIQQWLPLLQLVSSTLSIGLALYTITTD